MNAARIATSSLVLDEVVKRFMRNLSFLMSAHAVTALLGLVTLAVMSRALGPAGLGVVAIIEAYVRAVDQLVRVEAWQAIVRYGVRWLADDRGSAFARLLKLGTLVDVAGASLAALVAAGGCLLFGPLLHLDPDQVGMTLFYSSTLIFGLSSTPTAILRLYDRFDILSKVLVLFATFRLVFIAGAWAAGGGLWTFVVLLSAHAVLEPLTIFVLAWREFHRRSGVDIWTVPLTEVLTENPGFVRFVLNTNFNVVARQSTQRFDTLIVGSIAGPAAAGLYQVARRIGIAALRLSRPIQQAIYPELARLWSEGQRRKFTRFVFIVEGTLASVSILGLLVTLPFVEPVVVLAFGEAFRSAAPLVALQLFATALFLSGTALTPGLMSMGADRPLLLITLVGTAVFFVSIVPLTLSMGPLGGLISHTAFNAIWLIGCLMMFHRYRNRDRVSDASGAAAAAGSGSMP